MNRSYPNIEKSAYRPGLYVGWDARGNRYHIRKDGPHKARGSWWVYPMTAEGMPCFYAGTLALVSLRLERCSAICAKPRLAHEVTP